MVTNNKYYKTIYENVTGLTVTGHHKNTYYMRKVCESYGVVYDEFKPLVKYVKDFATALEIDVGTKHKPLRTLLHMIAEELYSGSLEHDTVNYYLKIISENIVPPIPVAYNTTWTLNGVESGESAILSHADSQNAVFVFTVEDINGHPVSNCQIPIEVDGEAVSPIPTTDADGVASFTYASQGVGDVSVSADIMVNGILVSKTYSIEDCRKYISTGSHTHSSGIVFTKIYEMPNNLSNYEVTAKFKSTFASRCALVLKRDDNQTNTYYIRLGFDNNQKESTLMTTTGSDIFNGTASANTSYNFKFKLENEVISTYIDDDAYHSANLGFTPSVITFLTWGSESKTVSFEDLKIKPL